jgi:putative ABC transport system substrate-binding protein
MGTPNASRRLASVWGIILTVALALGPATFAANSDVAIFFPAIREPYRTVFSNIISGIEQGTGRSATQFEITEAGSFGEAGAWLGEAKPKVIIALGRRGLAAAKEIEGAPPIIAGGAMLTPKDAGVGVDGISLVADPDRLFGALQRIDPTVRRIVTVYNPERSQWLIDYAVKAAEQRGLVLIAKPARDLRDAVRVYREIFEDRDLRGAALWLPQDPATVDTNTVLPMVLAEAWDQNRLVFSSLLGHVPRGVLFAMYPDNEAMGRSLAELAMRRISKNSSNGGIKPLKDLKFAINLRTADHLGLSFSKEQERQFDLTFPAR